MKMPIVLQNIILALPLTAILNIGRVVMRVKQFCRVQKNVSVLIVGMALLGMKTAYAETVTVTIEPEVYLLQDPDGLLRSLGVSINLDETFSATYMLDSDVEPTTVFPGGSGHDYSIERASMCIPSFVDAFCRSTGGATIFVGNDPVVINGVTEETDVWQIAKDFSIGDVKIQMGIIFFDETATRIDDESFFVNDSFKGWDSAVFFMYGNHQTLHTSFKMEAEAIRGPVIIIPGTTGSSLHFEGRELWPGRLIEDDFLLLQYECDGINPCNPITPGVKPGHLLALGYGSKYSGLIRELIEEGGYTLYDPSISIAEQPDANLFPFPYDWRKPIGDLADDLNSFINDKIKPIWEDTKINVIAHSMGNLVTKAYLYEYSSEQNIGKFIRVGAPILGSPEMYNVFRYAGPFLFPHVIGYEAKSFKIVVRNLPGGYDLLPSRKYFNISHDDLIPEMSSIPIKNTYIRDPLDQDGNGYLNHPKESLGYAQTKNFLKNALENYVPLDPPLEKLNSYLIDAAEQTHENLDNWWLPSQVKNFVIAGSGRATVGTITERKESRGEIFEKPPIDIEWCNGEGTVPLWSAVFVKNKKDSKFYFTNKEAKHGKLLTKKYVQILIINILNGIDRIEDMPELAEWSEPPISYNPYPYKGKSISVHSPVSLTVYDSSGNETSFVDNTLVEDIPGSTLVVLGGPEGSKSVFVPDGDNYRVVIESLSNEGFFDLTIEDIDNGDSLHKVEFTRIPINANTVAESSIDDEISSSILNVDDNGDGIVDRTFKPIPINAPPYPVIQVNNSDGPITLGTGDTLLVNVSLTAGSSLGVDCDWWVAASTPFGWYYFDVVTMNWVYAGDSYTDLSFTYQGPLFDLIPSFEVLNKPGLPVGTYKFYFAVDTNMNGSLDLDELFFDSVVVNISP